MRLASPALVLNQPHGAPHLEDVTVDDPGPGEVRVRLVASGVCHTDISAVRDARYWPMVLGHEGAGIVESVGDGVNTLQPGDRVILSWRAACGRCRRCLRGRQDLCEDVRATASSRVHRANGEALRPLLNTGAFCHYAVVPAEAAIRIRPEMPLDKAALIGCGVATGVGAVMNTAAVQPGEDVAVFGTGGVGLNVVQGARLAHAARVIAVDRIETKLRLARDFGATHALLTNDGDPVQAVRDLTGGRGVDHAFEVVGLPALMDQALRALAPGGALTLVGAAARDATFAFHPRAFLSAQQTVRGCIYGSCRPPLDFPLMVDWYLRGLLKLDELHTGTIDLDALPPLFEHEAPPHSIRTIVRFEG